MRNLSYILCCHKDGDDFALIFNDDELKDLSFKYHYFLDRGYSFVFYSLKDCVFELSDIKTVVL